MSDWKTVVVIATENLFVYLTDPQRDEFLAAVEATLARQAAEVRTPSGHHVLVDEPHFQITVGNKAVKGWFAELVIEPLEITARVVYAPTNPGLKATDHEVTIKIKHVFVDSRHPGPNAPLWVYDTA